MDNTSINDKEPKHNIININVAMKLTTSWQDTGINGDSIPDDGVYAIKLLPYSNNGSNDIWLETVAGIMAWYSSGTNSPDAFEIYTHESGHATNGHKIYLRTLRTWSGGVLHLQIKDQIAWRTTDTLHFYFVRLL